MIQTRNEMVQELMRYVIDLPQPLDELCRHVVLNTAFQFCPASRHNHHNYEHGLLEHTLDVVNRIHNITSNHLDELTTAAIWHDFHKIHEYDWRWEPSKLANGQESMLGEHIWVVEHKPYQSFIGHIAGGYTEWVRMANLHNVRDSVLARIGHSILSHHGRLEWGSPVEPQTDDAFLLHSMDMRSVQEAKANGVSS